MGFMARLIIGRNLRLVQAARRRLEYRCRRRGLMRILPVGGNPAAAFVPSEECLFCHQLRDWEDWSLADLAQNTADPTVTAGLACACVPHAFKLVSAVPRPSAAAIVDAVTARLEAAASSLGGDATASTAFLVGRFPRTTRAAVLPTLNAYLADGATRQTASLSDAGPQIASISPLDATTCMLCQAVAAAAEPEHWLPAHPKDLCWVHAAVLLQRRGPAAAADLAAWARTVLDQCLERASCRSRSSAAGLTCRACQAQVLTVARTLATLESVGATELEHAWFCLPHLPLVLRRMPRDGVVPVLVAEETFLARLHHEIEEFFRKSEYRYRHEPKGGEQTAWVRAADVLAGAYPADDGYEGEVQRALREQAWRSLRSPTPSVNTA